MYCCQCTCFTSLAFRRQGPGSEFLTSLYTQTGRFQQTTGDTYNKKAEFYQLDREFHHQKWNNQNKDSNQKRNWAYENMNGKVASLCTTNQQNLRWGWLHFDAAKSARVATKELVIIKRSFSLSTVGVAKVPKRNWRSMVVKSHSTTISWWFIGCWLLFGSTPKRFKSRMVRWCSFEVTAHPNEVSLCVFDESLQFWLHVLNGSGWQVVRDLYTFTHL